MKYVLLLLLLFLVCWVKAQDPGRYDVVIHEIFADPTPSRGLPASEFIEIRNRSSTAWNLRNWTISSGGNTGRINSAYLLQPDSMVILCGSSAAAAYQKFGAAVVVSSFPSLDNDGDTLVLSSPAGVVHALVWNKDWYGNDVKMDGGWSLEMVDRTQPCLGRQNWLASINPAGATPGRQNSVESSRADTAAPSLLYGYFKDSITAVLHFSEPISQDALQLVTVPALQVMNSLLRKPLFEELEIQLSIPLKEEAIITFEASGFRDCAGNKMHPQSISTGRFSQPFTADLVINEILFDPPADGSDYVEIYNKSNKIINIGDLLLANRGTDNKIASLVPLSLKPFPFLPGEYLLVSTDTAWVYRRYQPPGFRRSVQPASLPTFPDDQGEAVLLNNNAVILDELVYDQKWHFALVADPRGISLERISVEQKTNDPFNWHSASTSSGYGTPGYRNSQSPFGGKTDGTITLTTTIISPDMDGRDDFLQINYSFPQPGNVAYVTIFDSRGRVIKSVAAGSICGTAGSFRWDGMNNSGALALSGVYIVLTEVFDLQGKTKKYRNTVALYR